MRGQYTEPLNMCVLKFESPRWSRSLSDQENSHDDQIFNTSTVVARLLHRDWNGDLASLHELPEFVVFRHLRPGAHDHNSHHRWWTHGRIRLHLQGSHQAMGEQAAENWNIPM